MPNITTLAFSVEFDISTGVPKITLTNNSAGSNLAACKYWAVVTTPSGTIMHEGTQGLPDIVGAWSTWDVPGTWPQPFGEIEWSGYPYTITLNVDDGTTPTPVVLTITKQATICRPNGNTAASKNNFGVGSFTSKVQCSLAKIFCQDTTKYLYKDSNGTVVTQQWTLVYPPDSNAFSPVNQVVSGLPYVYFDISYNAEGYNVFMNTVVRYDLGNGVTVKIAYKGQSKLNVQCGIDLCELICSYQDLIGKVENSQCSDQNSAEFKQTLLLINSKMNIVMMAEAQGCDVDVPALIQEIKKLGGFDCGCANNSTGGGVFPTPPAPSSASACCPQSLSVLVQGTTQPPSECPNSFFPASIYGPDGVTWLGMAYSADDMISIINGNAAWRVYGTAYPQGNCQVAFVKNPNISSVPPVYVTGGIGTGFGSGTTGTGSTAKQCVSGKQNYLAVLTDSCTGAAETTLPVNVTINYGSGPDYSLGNITTMAALITALNAESHKPGSVSYSIGTMPGAFSILVKNTNCPAYVGPISLLGDQFCNPIIVDVHDIATGTPPASCPGSYFPATVFDANGTTVLGTASDVNGMIALINGSANWQAFGVASYYSMCQVQFTKKAGVGVIPPIIIKDATSTACTDDIQSYIVGITDNCNPTVSVTSASFPLVGVVDFGIGGGEVSLGTVTSWADFIAKLNATPTKPASVTFSIGVLPNSIEIYNANCTTYPGTPSISGMAASSQFLLFGANHNTETVVAPTANGTYAVALGTSSVLGHIAGATANKKQWHTIQINKTLLVAEGDTGKVYWYDITNPLMPALYATVQLNDTGSGNCFTGNPHTINAQSGGVAVASFYSLYFPTDYSNMPIDSVILVEGTTGSIWKINSAGVINSYQDQRLLGKCPRVLVSNKLYLTQDGDLETRGSLASGLILGQIPVMDVNNFTGGGITVKTIFANNIEYVWAASYDLAGNIYFTSNLTSVAKYNIASDTIPTRVLNLITAVHAGANFLWRLNTTFYNNWLFFVPQDTAAALPGMPIRVDSSLIGLSLVYFNISLIPTHKAGYNLKPLGNCMVVVTQFNPAGPAPGYLSLFKTDGTYLNTIPVAAGQVYNVVPVPNVSVYTPNSFV